MRSFLFFGAHLAFASESDVCAATGECAQDEATLLQMHGLRDKDMIKDHRLIQTHSLESGSTYTTTGKVKGPYQFVHDGHCAGGWLGGNTNKADILACAAHCNANANCGYFAFCDGPTGCDGNTNCALYSESGNCPNDNNWAGYNAFHTGETGCNDVYEAEDASLSGGSVDTNHEGYTGSGFYNYHDNNDYIEWTLPSCSGGEATLAFRYALRSGDRPLVVTVNGAVVNNALSTPATGSWDIKYSRASVRVTLNAGTNTVRLAAGPQSGANVDSLIVQTGAPDYFIAPYGSDGCPDGTEVPSAAECRVAHRQLGLEISPEWNGNYAPIPAACTTREYNWGGQHHFHFNTRATGTGRADLAPVCRAGPNYGEAGGGNDCFGSDVSEADCLDAAQSLLASTQSQGRSHLVAGSWGWVPPGCSVQTHFTHNQNGDFAAHFNRNNNGANDGGYTKVCYSACQHLQNTDVVAGTFAHYGRDYSGSPSAEECAATCTSDDECTAWVWRPSTGNCWISRQAVVTFEPDTDRTTGLRCN